MSDSVLGFSVIPYGDPVVGTFVVPGTNSAPVRLSMRKEIAPLLLAFARDFNALVEALDPKSCGCHNPRKVAGSSTWSRHAPAIAMDFNWNRHPMGASGTFSASQRAAITKILDRYKYNGVRVFRWGGDYSGRKDEMHFEINVTRDIALKATAVLQTPVRPAPKPPSWYPGDTAKRVLKVTTPNMRGTDVQFVQRYVGPKHCGTADGVFGAHTREGVIWYQNMRGIKADGIVGPQTWHQMGER